MFCRRMACAAETVTPQESIMIGVQAGEESEGDRQPIAGDDPPETARERMTTNTMKRKRYIAYRTVLVLGYTLAVPTI